MSDNDHLVEVENLYMYFPVTAGVLQKRVADVKAVDGVSFHIKKGETLGLGGGRRWGIGGGWFGFAPRLGLPDQHVRAHGGEPSGEHPHEDDWPALLHAPPAAAS